MWDDDLDDLDDIPQFIGCPPRFGGEPGDWIWGGDTDEEYDLYY